MSGVVVGGVVVVVVQVGGGFKDKGWEPLRTSDLKQWNVTTQIFPFLGKKSDCKIEHFLFDLNLTIRQHPFQSLKSSQIVLLHSDVEVNCISSVRFLSYLYQFRNHSYCNDHHLSVKKKGRNKWVNSSETDVCMFVLVITYISFLIVKQFRELIILSVFLSHAIINKRKTSVSIYRVVFTEW